MGTLVRGPSSATLTARARPSLPPPTRELSLRDAFQSTEDVLAANLLLENFVEPKVMGKSLDLHPVMVLIVTALGGLLGGIVGLILAVPAYVIARTGTSRLRSRGVVDKVASHAEPAVKQLLR